jgi:hypothetical protein
VFSRLTILGSLLVSMLGAQAPTTDNAGYGAIYRDVELDAQTGNVLHLGVAVSPLNGHIFVSATGSMGLPPHKLYEFDAVGALLTTRSQPSVQSLSSYGMRDLECDGQSLLGGSEVGISVVSPLGVPVNVIVTANGPQPISQPIGGAALLQLGVIRALALDPQGNNGAGSLYVANFGSPILECALDGSILRTIPNGGWQAYGLALDPTTRNLWVSTDAQGRIAEIDRLTGLLTGHSMPSVAPGSLPGGLSLASGTPGHHERWGSSLLLAELSQGQTGPDHLGIHRVRLYPGVEGWDEPTLLVGTNGNPLARGTVTHRAGDRLDLRVEAAGGRNNGMPCWTFVNFYRDAATDAYTDLASLFPQSGLLHEFRFLTGMSTPSTSTYGILAHAIGATASIQLPPGLPVRTGDLLRFQSIYLEPQSQHVFAATNEGHFVGQDRERGIVVSAAGPNSFQSNPAAAFWQVRSDTSHAHGAILWVEISYVGATGPAALQRFDLDQNGMGDRFDGGNSTLVGARGTYRGGSDVLCGLDYAAPGVYVDPTVHGTGQSGGFAATLLPGYTADASSIRFRFQAFGPGKAFRFDCDTDGGLPSGEGQIGAIVRVGTANSGVLQGLLQQDPANPERAVVFFP